MTQQLENSLDRFAPAQSSSVVLPLAAAGVGVLILSGLILSLAAGMLPAAGVLSLALLGLAVLFYLASRERRRLIARSSSEWIEWEAALPEVQRENLKISVTELSGILGTAADSAAELQTAFVVAQDLALRQLQQDEGVPVVRHISVAGVPFDAVYSKGEVLACGEVMFLVAPELGQERIVAAMKKIAAAKRTIAAINIDLEVRLVLILITQMPDEEVAKLRDSLSTARFSATITDIDMRLFDFEELQRTYVSEAN